jgi:hypothetical protein
MKCKHQEHINQWLEDRLASGQRAAFEIHLKECVFCKKEVMVYQKLNELLRSSIPITQPSLNFERIFWQKILEREKEPWWAKRFRDVESLIPTSSPQVAALLFFALIIGGAGGVLSAMNTLTPENIASNRASIRYLSGFREFNGIPSPSVAASYLKTVLERENS